MKFIFKIIGFIGGLVAFTFLLMTLVVLLFVEEIIYYERSLFILIPEIIMVSFFLVIFLYDHAEYIIKHAKQP